MKTLMWKDTCASVFTAALFIIAKAQNQRKGPSTDDWIKQLWYIHAMECHSAIVKSEVLPSAATWMDLGNIMLSEINQTSPG